MCEATVLSLKRVHKNTWTDKPSAFWFFGLLEEVVELGLSLLGLHRHAPEYELKQISSIALNWMEMRHSRWQKEASAYEEQK